MSGKKILDLISKNKKLIINLILIIIAYKLILFLAAFLYYFYTLKLNAFDPSLVFGIWKQWDAGAYLQIAESGYNLKDKILRFFPVLPLAILPLGKIIGFKLSAYIVNTVALFFFLLGLQKLVVLDDDDDHAWRAIMYYLIFPTAIFLTGYYSECLFLAFAVWNFYFTRKRMWLQAGVLGFLASLTRTEGPVLAIFMLYEYLSMLEFNLKKLDLKIIYAFFPILGIICYCLFQQLMYGDFLLFLKDHAAPDKKLSFPWESLGNYIAVMIYDFQFVTTPYYISRAIDLVFFITSLLLGAIMLLKHRISYALYVVSVSILSSFNGDLASSNRRGLLLFPAVIYLAKLGKNTVINFIIVLLFANLFPLFLFRYIFGLWTG